jgi:O-antigen/teichoic acid export membrane protein
VVHALEGGFPAVGITSAHAQVTMASVEGTLYQVENASVTAPSAAPAPRDGAAARRNSPLRTIMRGFTWVTASQLITAAGNLVLTPFVIHGLGVERYGLFVLTGTITTFLGSLNGGLGATANRYFPIYAGADDRVATTRLFVTFLLFVTCIGSVVGVVDWFVSPVIVRSLSMSPSLRPESLFLFRTLGVLLTLALAHQLVQSVVVARQRFDRAIEAGLLCYALWVVGLILVVHYHEGLKGVGVVFMVQQAAAVVVMVPSALRYLSRKGLRLVPRAQLRELFSFSAKMQVLGIAGLINIQLDTLVVGTALSVRTVGIYNSGNSFAGQLSSVVNNVVTPASVQLGNTYGKEGEERAFHQFSLMQRNWVAAVTGWTAVGMGAAYFGVTAWLGPEFKMGGWVAIVCIAGSMFSLGAALVSTYVTVMRQAGIELRYGLVQMGVNLVLTLPLALVGAVAVAIGAASAQVVAAVYLVWVVRRRIRPDIPNFIKQIPVFRGALAALVTVAGELVIRPHVTIGAIGLLECVLPAAVGLVVFALTVVGPAKAARLVSRALQR